MSLDVLNEFAKTAAGVLQRLGVSDAAPHPARISIKTERFDDTTAANRALTDLSAAGGWAQHPSVVRILAASPVSLREEDGPILEAELFGESKSWRMRHIGGAWQLTTFEELRDTGAGEACLVTDEPLLATDPHLGALNYRVYWRRGEAGWRPFAARLAGFSKNAQGDTDHA